MPALKGSLKGIWHYVAEPAIGIANSDKKTRFDYAKEHGEMSEDGYQFAILNEKTKNLKRGFKWGLELEDGGYTSNLVEKLGFLNKCYQADEMTQDQYEGTVAQILKDLEEFHVMTAISDDEYRDTLATIQGQVMGAKGFAR